MDLTYAAIMASAIGLAFCASRWTQRSLPLSGGVRGGIGLGAFVGAMLGAKLPFVLSDWSGFISGAAWFTDGKTILSGLVGGYLGVEIAKWILDVRVRTGDSFAIPVSLAIGVGRLGCFHAGCCYGRPTQVPWGVVFPAIDQQLRHPTQLYEAVFHFACTGACCLAIKHRWFVGHQIKAYILVYAIYRYFSEFLRPEPRLALLGWTNYQWFSLIIVAGFLTLWAWEARRFTISHTPEPRKKTDMSAENH